MRSRAGVRSSCPRIGERFPRTAQPDTFVKTWPTRLLKPCSTIPLASHITGRVVHLPRVPLFVVIWVREKADLADDKVMCLSEIRTHTHLVFLLSGT